MFHKRYTILSYSRVRVRQTRRTWSILSYFFRPAPPLSFALVHPTSSLPSQVRTEVFCQGPDDLLSRQRPRRVSPEINVFHLGSTGFRGTYKQLVSTSYLVRLAQVMRVKFSSLSHVLLLSLVRVIYTRWRWVASCKPSMFRWPPYPFLFQTTLFYRYEVLHSMHYIFGTQASGRHFDCHLAN